LTNGEIKTTQKEKTISKHTLGKQVQTKKGLRK